MGLTSKALALGGGVAAGYLLERQASRFAGGWPGGTSLATLEGPEGGDDGYISCDTGSKIFWHAAGTGSPTFLFVHGICLTGAVWRYQKEALAATHRVVTIDTSGHGASNLGNDHTEMAGFASDLATVIEELDLRDVVVVGHSMGGMITQQLLVERPDLVDERLRGAVLLSTSPTGRLATAAFSGSRVQHRLTSLESSLISPLGTRVAGYVSLERILADNDTGMFLTRIAFGSGAHASEIEFTRRLVANTPPKTFRTAAQAVFGFDVRHSLHEINLPVLVISGRRDAITPLYLAYESAEKLTRGRLEVVAGGGHMIMFEDPDLLTSLLADFVHSLDPKPGGVGGRGLAGMMEVTRHVR